MICLKIIHTVDLLAQIWHQVLRSIWVPDIPIEHLNDDSIPLTFVAFFNDKPVGMCSLRENDGIRPDLMPWLGSIVVAPDYQKQGIGEMIFGSDL